MKYTPFLRYCFSSVALLLCSCAFSNAPISKEEQARKNLGEPYCTSLEDLNESTAYWLDDFLEDFLSFERYVDVRRELRISPSLSTGDFRLLSNERDSVVCQKIREESIGLEQDQLMYDVERDRWIPFYYVVVFEAGDLYFSVIRPNNPGSDEGIGVPTMGITNVATYDKNLEVVGESSL